MGQHHSLKTLHDDWSECYWSVIIQVGGWTLLGKGDDDCGLKAGGNDAVAEGKVEDGGKNISQLTGACSESPSRDVVWFSCLAGVDVPQNFMMALFVHPHRCL